MILETPPKGILTDEDAAWMQANFHTAPPDKKAFVEAKLNEYRAFRRQHPSPVMVAQDAKNEDTVLGLYEAPEKADFGPLFPTLPEAEKRGVQSRVTNEYFLAQSLRVPREQLSDSMYYAAARGQVAGQLFGGRGADSDEGFAREARAYLTKRRDRRDLIGGREGTDETTKAINEKSLTRWATRAALAGQPSLSAFAQWKAEAKVPEGEDLFPIWNEQFNAVAQKTAPHRKALDEGFLALRRGMGLEKEGASVYGGVIDAASPLSGMSVEDFRTVGIPALRAMAEVAAGSDKDRLQQTLEAFGRPVQNAGGSFLDALDWFGQSLAQPAGTPSVQQGDAQRTLKTLLRAVADDYIDPIRVLSTSAAGKTAEQMLYDVSGSFGHLATVAVPGVGVAASMAAYQDSNQAQLLLRNPSMAVQDAQLIAAAAAPVQTALDRLSLKTLAGRMPGLSTLIQRAGAPGGNAGVRFALYGAGAFGTEYTAEKLQDAAPLAMQDLLSALKSDVPGADWTDFKLMDGRTAFAVLPLALLGAGVNAVRDQRSAKSLLQDTEAQKIFGLSDEQIATIQESPQPMMQLQKEWRNRKPPADAAEQWKAYGARLEQEATEEKAALDSAGATMERITGPDGNAVYRVDAGGVLTEHSSAGSALAAIRESMVEADRQENGPLLEMLAELDANPLSPVREGSVTLADGETVTGYQAARAAIMQDESAAPEARARAERESEAMTRRQQVFEKQFPDTPVNWNAVAVGGQSELEVKDGVARAVLKVSRGESPYTALEEKSEAEAEAWVRSGAVTWDRLGEMIRQVEQATGDRYLSGHTEGVDAAQDRLAVKEAYSELAQVHATGRSRAGARAASGIAEVARMDRTGSRMKLRDALRRGKLGEEISARLKAHVEWLKAVVGKAVRLNRARREAGGRFDLDEFLDKSVGIGAEDQHADGVVQEADRIYTPPSPEQEAEGIAFNLASNQFPSFTVEKITDFKGETGAELLPGGRIHVRLGVWQWNTSARDLIDDALLGLSHVEGEFWRGTDNKNELDILDSLVSKNHADGRQEPGVAVSRGLSYPGYKYYYKLKGEIAGTGSDGEPSLKNAKAITKLMPLPAADKISTKTLKGNLEKIGWTYEQFKNAIRGNLTRVENDPSFRLSPVATLDRLAAQMARRTRDPEARRKVYEQMTRALDTLRRNWTEIRTTWNGEGRAVIERKSKRELDKEQAFREAAAYQDAEDRIYDTLTPAAQHVLGMTGEDTSAFAGPLAQRFTGGRFGTRGRIKSRSAAIREADAWFGAVGGEYDGIEGLPSMFFGGGISADEAAQEAFEAGEINEPTPDALWDSMRSELQTQAGNREAMKAALSALKEEQRQARRTAKEEAGAWRAEQDAMQKQDWDGRAVMLRHLRTLDAILSALPAEIRGKVGGWTAVASLRTPDAMAKELEHRLAVADAHLEAHLKQQALDDIRALLEKARPDREAGKRSKGKLGAAVHRFFEEVERVVNLSPLEVSQQSAILEANLLGTENEKGELVPLPDLEAADIFEKQMVLDQFGALGKQKSHDAAHLAAALDRLEQVYVEGRNRWRMLEEARLAEVAAKAAEVVATLGGPSYAASQARKRDAQKLKSRAANMALDLKSFREVLETLLGESHSLTLEWSRAVREGFAQRNDALRGVRRRWREALHAATGKKGVRANRALWDMGDNAQQKIQVRTAGEGTTQTLDVPLEVIAQWQSGESKPSALGVSNAEAAELMTALDGMAPDDRRMSLPLVRQSRGPVETVPMTEAEGVFLTMLARQDQYSAALDKSGWDADAIAQIEAQLSPVAKALREFMTREYADGYTPLAQVFERMFGVSLPQIKNYAPAAFYHVGEDRASDPTAAGTVEGGFRSGFLKNRKQHAAAPQLENAFATFFGHAAQTAHWRGMAEVVRELRGVFGRPEVKRAIEGAHGKPMLGVVNQWLKSLEGNGLQQSSGQTDAAVRWLSSQQAYIALAWKLGTLMKQSGALLGAAYKMPAAAYARGFARLIAGRLEVRQIYSSPVIQRRLETGFAPEVRAALYDIWNSKPSRRTAFLEKGMEVIGLMDAIFTTGSAAIAYDYHFQTLKNSGIPEPEAARLAMQEVEDIVGATAQPADVADRSLFEARQGAFGRLLFMFASEARQKSSLWLTAWRNTLPKAVGGRGNPSAADLRVLALSHLVLGPMMQAISSAWRDARDDDDEWTDAGPWGVLGFLDLEHWDPWDFVRAAVAGPLSGIPLIGDALSGFEGGGVLSRFTQAGKAASSIVEGAPPKEDEPVEWYFKRTTRILQGLDAFSGVAGSLSGQAVDSVDNLIDDDQEESAKKKRVEARAKREAKEEK